MQECLGAGSRPRNQTLSSRGREPAPDGDRVRAGCCWLCPSSAESVYPTLGSFRSWSVTVLGAPPFQLFLFLVPAQVLGERMVGVCLCVSGVQATATAWRRTDFLSSPCHRPMPPTQPRVICWAKQQPCAESHRAFEFVEQIQVEANLKTEVQAPPLQCPTQKWG